MTEQEFMKQIWRPFDTVEIEGGIKGRVLNVCFTTRSVKVPIGNGCADWFDCKLIISHQSNTGNVDDAGIIESLHNRLMAANDRNDAQQRIIEQQREKIQSLNDKIANASNTALRKSVNIIAASLVTKKKTIEDIDKAVARINELLDGKE